MPLTCRLTPFGYAVARILFSAHPDFKDNREKLQPLIDAIRDRPVAPDLCRILYETLQYPVTKKELISRYRALQTYTGHQPVDKTELDADFAFLESNGVYNFSKRRRVLTFDGVIVAERFARY